VTGRLRGGRWSGRSARAPRQLARYFERMRGIIEAHEGTVEKFIGDAVMAVFGVPVVHEDDALRACRAALEMQATLPELGLEGRIGIQTGEVVVGTAERLATGDTVNVAARLEHAAGPGEILLGGESTAVAASTGSFIPDIQRRRPRLMTRSTGAQSAAAGFGGLRDDPPLLDRLRERGAHVSGSAVPRRQVLSGRRQGGSDRPREPKQTELRRRRRASRLAAAPTHASTAITLRRL
jgi:Adenylate and Guanylate cyclase catalytic domain